MSRSRDLLTLNMIVKNEALTLDKTLASIKPFIDRWVIVDTGSTDGTSDVVRRLMDGVPGEIVEIPFVDFATTRNAALDACGEVTEFILVLDAEDELFGGAKLRAFLEKEKNSRGKDHEAYYVRVDAGVKFSSARVLRARDKWRYRGVVHEVLTRQSGPSAPTIVIPEAQIVHTRAEHSEERTMRRFARDLALLQAEHERNPTDGRTAFYLAQTYASLGRREEAIAAYQKRVDMGGWREEVYLAKLAAARLAHEAGHPWGEVLERYLDAHAFAPHRAEPLFEIARYYNAVGQHALCMVFARRAMDLPYPKQDQHFIDDEVYTWKVADLVGTSAYWVGDFDRGEQAARQALRYRPDDPRLQKNLSFYIERKKTQRAKGR